MGEPLCEYMVTREKWRMRNIKTIYTALTKGYDDLLQPEVVRDDYDYICFSNDFDEEQIGIWRIRRLDSTKLSGVRFARYFKLNPHIVLSEYDYSIWVDANVTINDCIYERAEELIREKSSCATCDHPFRENVYEEATALLQQGVGEPYPVYKQTLAMLKAGFMNPGRLPVTSLFYRKHMEPDIISFSEYWWEQCARFSSRDQLGVNFALQRAGIEFDKFLTSEEIMSLTRGHKYLSDRKTIKDFIVIAPKRARRFIVRTILGILLARKYKAYRVENGE
jgi:hypothetical protein